MVDVKVQFRNKLPKYLHSCNRCSRCRHDHWRTKTWSQKHTTDQACDQITTPHIVLGPGILEFNPSFLSLYLLKRVTVGDKLIINLMMFLALCIYIQCCV